MIRVPAPRVLAGLLLAAIIIAAPAAPAQAQYRPLPAGNYSVADNPVGEPYHVEFGVNWWTPSPNIVIASESLGIPGTDIDIQANLGVEKQSTYEMYLVLRPGKKHKFRFNYIPQKYEADTVLTGEIIFNGIRFPVNTQVGTLLEWKTYRIGYEYDFLSKPRWFAGFILEAKFTDINFELDSIFGKEFVEARAPIPAIGFIGRGWVTKNVALTGEFTVKSLESGILRGIAAAARHVDREHDPAAQRAQQVRLALDPGHRKVEERHARTPRRAQVAPAESSTPQQVRFPGRQPGRRSTIRTVPSTPVTRTRDPAGAFGPRSDQRRLPSFTWPDPSRRPSGKVRTWPM